MICRRISLLAVINLLTVANTVAAFLINSTIFGTDISHVTYEPANEMCTRRAGGSFIWQAQTGSTQNCEAEAASWVLERYRTQQRFATFHRSLDHHIVSLTINFEGVAIWLYAPPRTKFLHPIPDYKVCVHDDDKFWSTSSCYHVDVNAALLDTVDDSVPAVFFAQGGLWPGKHRIVVSMAKPKNDTQAHNGILFSHAVYSVVRPTPWPVKEDSWRFREIVMHATHPALSYSPSMNFRACSNKKYKTGPLHYRAESGKMESWRSLGLCGGLTYSGVATNFTASAVAIYGAPWTQLVAPVHIGNTCVRVNSGPCEVIDAFHAYLSSNHDHEPVVLWRHDALNPSRETELSIQLMPTKDRNAVFPFKEIRYLEGREYASPHQSVGRPEEVHVPHDDPAVVYHPVSRCVRDIGRVCTKWFDPGPWVWREAGPAGSVLTYRSTLASYQMTDDPYIKLEFRGSEVRVYGAPKSLVKLPLAPQKICLNNICQLVDTEQAYLNTLSQNTAPFSETHPELNPVLLWSIGGLDDQIPHTLRLALAPSPSADDAEMTIAKIVYTKVTYEPEQSRPETPAPGADSAYAGPSRPPHSSDWIELPNDPPPPPCPPAPSCPPAPPCPPVPLCPSAAPCPSAPLCPSASLCPSVPPSLLPSPTPTPMLAPPHSSDLTAPPHNPPPPTPPPSDPPVNFIVNRILPALIIAIGLHLIGPLIYRAVYPCRVEKRSLAHPSERNAT